MVKRDSARSSRTSPNRVPSSAPANHSCDATAIGPPIPSPKSTSHLLYGTRPLRKTRYIGRFRPKVRRCDLLWDDRARPGGVANQPAGQRPDEPPPGAHRGADDDGVDAQLAGD